MVDKIILEKSNNEVRRANGFLGRRHLQFLMLFLGAVIGYIMRTSMSVGIIAMMEENPPHPSIPTYPSWEKKNIILSSFFWGYVIPQIGAGQLVKTFGPKWFLAITTTIGSVFNILTPIMAAEFGEYGVIVCRVIQGLNQGFLFPSVHTALGRWTPKLERSRVVSFVYAGGPLGTVLSMPITGLIANSQLGWPTVFYLYGCIGLLWAILWSWIGRDSPGKDRKISTEEKLCIEGILVDETNKRIIKTPWKSIVTSMPMWAILIAHCGQNWGFWTLLTEIPSYMSEIMGYDIGKNSLLSALPYLVLWLLSFVFSPIADYLIAKQIFSIGTVRKIFTSIGLVVPALALLCLGFVDAQQKNLALILMVIAVGFNAATFCGYNVNQLDLAPNHAGVLMGIANSLANIFSIIAPLAVQAIGIDEKEPLLWQIVFSIAAAVYISTDLFFVIFGSGELQEWNNNDNSDKPNDEVEINLLEKHKKLQKK